MKPLLDFDDAGAADDHPARGVTVGDIRAWYDEMEQLQASLDQIIIVCEDNARASHPEMALAFVGNVAKGARWPGSKL